jgi:hypothetical protein
MGPDSAAGPSVAGPGGAEKCPPSFPGTGGIVLGPGSAALDAGLVPVRFEQIVPLFISEHIRTYCSQQLCEHVRQLKAKTASQPAEVGGQEGALAPDAAAAVGLDGHQDDARPASRAGLSVDTALVPGERPSSSDAIKKEASSDAQLDLRAATVVVRPPPATPKRLPSPSMPVMAPMEREAFAAVVMVDVSGYSKLSAYLAEEGPEGAHKLAMIMKGYLDRIISTILRHGADIVKFVGKCRQGSGGRGWDAFRWHDH